MSQGTTPLTHPNAPHNQPFQLRAGRRNLTKKNSWWNPLSQNYFRNAKKSKKDKSE